jgi:hypothetical protein
MELINLSVSVDPIEVELFGSSAAFPIHKSQIEHSKSPPLMRWPLASHLAHQEPLRLPRSQSTTPIRDIFERILRSQLNW